MMILFQEPPPIPLHALAALAALAFGGVQLSLKKGTMLHKWLGRIWVGLMLVVALSSFAINELRVWGRYSPIHLISIFTIFSIVIGVYFARVGRMKGHKYAMISLYIFGLVITGLFTLLPGRVMHHVVFG